LGIPIPIPEFRFHPTRRWRFDYAWPDLMIALEQEGGAWVKGRHTRGSGFVKDCEKYGEAFALGWTVVRATPQMIDSGIAIDWIQRRLKTKK
jgi:hypothetical protein